jgi:hypothetical protein
MRDGRDAGEVSETVTAASYAIDQLEIEANRRRAERDCRPTPPANGHTSNGRRTDVRLVRTSNGLHIECLRCGRKVTPQVKDTNR